MIAWRYTTDLENERHLFTNNIDNNYEVNTFICSCGHEEMIVSIKQSEVEFLCPECANTKYYDANFAKRNFEYFLYLNKEVILPYSYKTIQTDANIEVRTQVNLPSHIDFVRKKIYFKLVSVSSISIDFNGKIKETTIKLNTDEKTYEIQDKMLNDYLNKNALSLKLPTHPILKLNTNKASFFFINKHLKEHEFYYWLDIQHISKKKDLTIESAFTTILQKREEKSLKKAVYRNYTRQMEEYMYYSPYLPMLFIKNIKDVNILVRLLNLDIYTLDISKYRIKELLKFLQKSYSEKQIFRLFCELDETSVQIFEDMLQEIEDLEDIDTFLKETKKPKCNLNGLHDSIVEYGRKQRLKKICGKEITNISKDFKQCVHIDNYEVKIPKSGDELYEWAGKLQNCMAAYFDAIADKRTKIYCFFKYESIEFAVEIMDKKLIQANGISNRRLTTEQDAVLTKWMGRFFTDIDKSLIMTE